MAQGVNTINLLPDPDLISKAVAHRRQAIQVTIDAMNEIRTESAKASEPFTVRKEMNRLHPLFKSTIQEIA